MVRWRLFLFFSLINFLYHAPAWGGTVKYFVDPIDSSRIWSAEIPYLPQTVLSVEELPKSSTLHPGVIFGSQRFSQVALSPDGSLLAFTVDGSSHDWSGVYDFANKKVRQLTLCFEGQTVSPLWSPDGRYLAVEAFTASEKKSVQVVDLTQKSQCLLDGHRGRNKFFNFSKPWWAPSGAKIYFRVDYNNVYRKSLGLKPKKINTRIGEAEPDCSKLTYYGVSEFMKKFPEEAQNRGATAQGLKP